MSLTVMEVYERLSPLHSDPEAFEREASRVRQEMLENVPEALRERYRAMLWRQDASLRKYKDPVARMNAAIVMFWEMVGKFQQTLEGIKSR